MHTSSIFENLDTFTVGNLLWVSYLEVVRVEENGVGDVQLAGHDVGDDVGQPQDVVVVAVRVPVGAQLLVVELGTLVLHRDVVDHLEVRIQR